MDVFEEKVLRILFFLVKTRNIGFLKLLKNGVHFSLKVFEDFGENGTPIFIDVVEK
ncbi:MAG: hypothetical protein FWH46_04320 [Methanimicrococcus sp.]|nr:hypothetical protein [Methanimicrococcus sp.]